MIWPIFLILLALIAIAALLIFTVPAATAPLGAAILLCVIGLALSWAMEPTGGD